MPTTPTTPELPTGAALYMLLGEINANVANTGASIARIEKDIEAGFSKRDAATEEVRNRVSAIERDLANREDLIERFEATETSAAHAHSRLDAIDTTGKVVGKIAGWLWAVGGAGLLALVWAVIKAVANGSL